MRRSRWVIVCAGLALACAGETSTRGSGAALGPQVEGEGTQRPDVEPPPASVVPITQVDEALLAIHALAPGSAEDGHGATVQAAAPVAIDLDAHAFPPRALDPVLTIGALRFTHYVHPRPGVLRFVVADAALLVPGETIAVHYARDASDERVVHVVAQADLSAARQP